MSGFATLVGFTVNERFGLPGLPPPYVVAQVALEEDCVRLTTHTVGCDPPTSCWACACRSSSNRPATPGCRCSRPRPNRANRRRCRTTRSSPRRIRTYTSARWPPPGSSRTRSRSPASACRRSAAASWCRRSP
ncbi:OB-fold domain-containing protein [Yinghuangia aomiensis]